MLALAASTGSAQPRWMGQPNDDDDDAELMLLGRALAYLRREAGLSQPQAADKIGTTAQNYGKYENGKASTLHRRDVQRRLASAVGADLETLNMVVAKLRGESAEQLERAFTERGRYAHLAAPTLTIRQRLQAAWTVDDDKMNFGTWHIGRDPRWELADQWLAEVLDDHAEGLGIGRGDLVHAVSASETGFYPRTGDIVIVQRPRPVEERELTLRQVENAPSGVLLHARTSNPRLRQQPIALPVSLQEAADAPRILAFVTASIRRY